MDKRQVLVVDDNAAIGLIIKRAGRAFDQDVEVTVDAEAFKSAFHRLKPDVIFLDVAIPECDGLELIKFLAAEGCQASIVVMSGLGDYYLTAAREMGETRGLTIGGTLKKPFRVAALHELLKTALGHADAA